MITNGFVLQLGQHEYALTKLNSRNDSLDAVYRYDIELFAGVDLSAYLGSLLRIKIQCGYRCHYLSGVLNRVARVSHYVPRRYWHCRVESPLCALGVRRNRVFRELTLALLLQQILQQNDLFLPDLDIVSCPQVTIRQLIQYQETDLALWQRLCASYNLHYHIVTEAQTITLKVYYGFPQLSAKQLPITLASGVQRDTPAIQHWTDCLFHQATPLAFAVSDDYTLAPFDCIEVSDRVWRVLLADRHFSTGQPCCCKILLLEQTSSASYSLTGDFLPWLDELGYQPQLSYPQLKQRRYHGFMRAMVEGNVHQGMVPIHFCWQQVQYAEVPSVRFAPGVICHQWPLRSVVLIAFVDDDIDKPIILSSWPKTVAVAEGSQQLAFGGLKLHFSNKQLKLATQYTACALTAGKSIVMNSLGNARIHSQADYQLKTFTFANMSSRQVYRACHSIHETAQQIRLVGQQYSATSQLSRVFAEHFQLRSTHANVEAKLYYLSTGSWRLNSEDSLVNAHQLDVTCQEFSLYHPHAECISEPSLLQFVSKNSISIRAAELYCPLATDIVSG
jgi:Phage tail baseplate hub (GPD)